mmetsp:Transcript_8131/g.10625  ORF Transcript_8131/g.10625 Transcript_8131/m.10625 type:complete len:94 (+) Transcript_8131:118-399(+)
MQIGISNCQLHNDSSKLFANAFLFENIWRIASAECSTHFLVPFNDAAMGVFFPSVYFMIGYAATAVYFFCFYFALVIVQHSLRGVFTFIRSIC